MLMNNYRVKKEVKVSTSSVVSKSPLKSGSSVRAPSPAKSTTSFSKAGTATTALIAPASPSKASVTSSSSVKASVPPVASTTAVAGAGIAKEPVSDVELRIQRAARFSIPLSEAEKAAMRWNLNVLSVLELKHIIPFLFMVDHLIV